MAIAQKPRLLMLDEPTQGLSIEETDRAIPIFEAAGDHVGLARAYRLLTWVHGTECRYGEAVEAAEAEAHAVVITGAGSQPPPRWRLSLGAVVNSSVR